MDMLAKNELERYHRQIMIDGFGEEGQEKLKKAKVFIAGAGGLGTIVAFYLTAAGVGKIRIVDPDRVELSNLNRQVLYWEKDIGRRKVELAKERLGSLNSGVQIEGFQETVTEDNVYDLLNGCDLMIDGLDNFPARFLLNKVAIEKNIPLFHGAVYGFEGRAMTIIPGETACLRCLYPETPSSRKNPVIGVTPAVIGGIQAAEAIKYVLKVGELLSGRLLIYDGLGSRFFEIDLKRDPECKECSR